MDNANVNATNPGSVHVQSSDKGTKSNEGVRSRRHTEKGRQYNCDRLKRLQASSLAAITRKRTEITLLMTDENDLHLVKTAVEDINVLFTKYQETHQEYLKLLSSEESQEHEIQRYEAREKSFLDFRQQVLQWIVFSEQRLSDELDTSVEKKSSSRSKLSKSLRGSHRSSSSIASSISSRTRERVKLAELQAEKSLLKRKQALDVAAEDLKLETEIAKAQARKRVYGEIIEKSQGVAVPVKIDQSEGTERNIATPYVGRDELMRTPTPRSSNVTPVITSQPTVTFPTPDLSVSSLSDFSNPAPTSPCTNPLRFVSSFRATRNNVERAVPVTDNGRIHNKNPYRELHKNSLEQLLVIQREQNEHMLRANVQMAAAMSLPKPEVSK